MEGLVAFLPLLVGRCVAVFDAVFHGHIRSNLSRSCRVASAIQLGTGEFARIHVPISLHFVEHAKSAVRQFGLLVNLGKR